jgi:hypothetical protein
MNLGGFCDFIVESGKYSQRNGCVYRYKKHDSILTVQSAIDRYVYIYIHLQIGRNVSTQVHWRIPMHIMFL